MSKTGFTQLWKGYPILSYSKDHSSVQLFYVAFSRKRQNIKYYLQKRILIEKCRLLTKQFSEISWSEYEFQVGFIRKDGNLLGWKLSMKIQFNTCAEFVSIIFKLFDMKLWFPDFKKTLRIFRQNEINLLKLFEMVHL